MSGEKVVLQRLKQLFGTTLIVVLIFNAAPVGTAAASEVGRPLTERWSLKSTFVMPESAAYDRVTKQIFVSNVNEYAKDGNGFVSRIRHDGTVVDLKWLDGLDSPTGMAVKGESLYVVDYDRLLLVDIGSATIRRIFRAPDATPALNDVAVSDSGEVFVSGSRSNTVYHVKNDELVVWKQDDELLAQANGLLVAGNHLIFGGKTLHVFDLDSRLRVDTFAYPQPSLEEIDGVTSDGCGGYMMTLINDADIWHLSKTGVAKPLTEQMINGIDLDFVAGKLYVPTVGGGLVVFDVRVSCDP